MSVGQDPYRSDEAFRRALADRLRTRPPRRASTSTSSGANSSSSASSPASSPTRPRREYSRAEPGCSPGSPRPGAGGDIDLYHPESTTDLDQAVAELTAALDRHRLERLRFTLETTRTIDEEAAGLRISAYLGATVVDRFTVDLSVHLRPLARPR